MVTQTEKRASSKDNDEKDEPKSSSNRTNGRARKTARPANDGTSTGTLIGVAAAGVAVGVAAMIGRKFAVQAPTMLAGNWDEALKAEHEATMKVVDMLAQTTAKHSTKRALLLANLKHMLSKHAFQEENVVYPALREHGQAEQADELNREHGYVKQALYELTKSVKTDDTFQATLTQLRSDLRDHMDDEENRLFPALKAELTPEQNSMVTRAMNKEGLKLA
jgi:hemerythrin superfamily protein